MNAVFTALPGGWGALISMWIPKGEALSRQRRLFETRHLLEERRYQIFPEYSKVYDLYLLFFETVYMLP